MKKIIFIVLISLTAHTEELNLPFIMVINKITGLNIGKKTEVNISLYAKNPSTICSLKIKNITNPYKKDISKTKFKTIYLDKGRYIREELKNILKGKYEFEYTWSKKSKFVESYLKSVRIFEYHNSKHKLHKRFNLTFRLRVPKSCK